MNMDFDVTEGGGEISIHGICHSVGASLLFPCLITKSLPTLKIRFDIWDASVYILNLSSDQTGRQESHLGPTHVIFIFLTKPRLA